MKTNTTTEVRRSSRTHHTAAILAAVFAAVLLPVSQVQGGPSGLRIVSDASWASSGTEQAGWQYLGFDDSSWVNAVTLPYVPLANYIPGSQAYPYPPESFIPGTPGQHIWDPGLAAVSPAFFRKSFTVPGYPIAFAFTRARVRVDDAYDFYVNGNLVASKPTELPSDAQEYDIAAYVREGENVFAIKAWNIVGISRAVLFDASVFYIPNSPPVADAGGPQSVRLGDWANLDGGASTDDLTPEEELGCKWSIESAPAGSSAVLNNADDSLTPWFVPDRTGVYTLKLLVLDSSGLQDSAETTITVNPILANGSFESDFTGWTASGNVRIQTSPPATDGVKHAGFNAGNSTPNGALTQLFATTSGQVYQVVFDQGALAYNTAEQRVRVDVIGTSGLQPVASQTVTQFFTVKGLGGGKTAWETKSFFFTANSAGATLTFRDASTTSDAIDLLLDNVRIMPVSPLVNGSFESNFDGWNVKGNVAVKDASPYDAIHGEKLAAFNTANAAPNGVLSQSFATIPGNTYLLSFDMGVLAYNTNEQRMQVTVTGVANAAFYAVSGLGGGKTRWETKRLSFTADRAMTTVSFFDSSTTSNALDLLLDHVKVEATSFLSNGSFESDFYHWATGGNVRIQTVPAATDGIKHAGFNAGNTTPNGMVSQGFETVPGATYPLSFDMGVLAYNTSEQRLRVEVAGTSALVDQIFTMKGLGGGKTAWASKSLFFIADSEFTTITFRDVSATTDAIDLLLDNVKVMPTPADLSLIPAGGFQMGDSLDGDAYAMPVHTVNVSTFYMAKFEVTWALWDEVKTWAASHGYTDLPLNYGDPNQPATLFKWDDVVKWCNARSEKEGLTPCYTVSGTVYRTGSSTPDCNWAANGYRLPTEAEWEKAARGELSGRRFPWGDTISRTQANYYSDGSFSYDVSPTLGSSGILDVGSFPASGYELYDMAGNVWEWCWDWASGSYYASSPGSDPRGPASGTYRVIRGGGASSSANGCRVATRFSVLSFLQEHPGFRPVRSSLQ